MISLLGECSYNFPNKIKLRYLIKDFIQKKADESYYLKDELIAEFERYIEKKRGGRKKPFLAIPSATAKGYMEAYEGDGVIPNWKGARGTVQGGIIPTLLTSPDTIGVVVDDKEG